MENKLKNISVISSNKILKSEKFNDFYFNSINPISECKYVYIDANNLIEKIEQTSNLVIGELGFGIGLNFLMTVKSLKKNLINNKHLHYISFEGYPLEHKQLKEIYSNFKELNVISNVLLNRLPLKMSGVHDIYFPEYNTTLTLVYDDFSSVKKFSFLADVWYLDGFAPKKNLSAWTEDILKNVYKKTKFEGTFSTFTSATKVRKDLIKVGFDVSKKIGFSHKREMLIGIKRKNIKKINLSFHDFNIEPVAIIGGGVTGASLAFSLKKRNIECFIVEKGHELGNGASGNLVAFQMPKLTLDDSIYGIFSLRSYLYSRNLAINLDSVPISNGVIIFPNRDRENKKFEELLNFKWPYELFHNYKSVEFQNFKNLHLFPNSGIVETKNFLKNLSKSVKFINNFEVKKIDHFKNKKILYNTVGDTISAKTVIWANGYEVKNELLKKICIPTSGQVTYIKKDINFVNQKLNYSYGNFFSQEFNDLHQIGSTFSKDLNKNEDYNNKLNIRNIPLFLKEKFKSQLKVVNSRFSIRSSTANRLPYFGSLEEENEFFIGGMGSWGFTYAPFLSELLVKHIMHEPKIIETKLLEKLILDNRI